MLRGWWTMWELNPRLHKKHSFALQVYSVAYFCLATQSTTITNNIRSNLASPNVERDVFSRICIRATSENRGRME